MGKAIYRKEKLPEHTPNMGVDPYTKDGQPKSYELMAEEILASCNSSVRDALYRSVWFDRVCEDILAEAEEIGYGDISEEEIQYAAELYVYHGKYDCNCSYWDNIDSVIEEAVSSLDKDGDRKIGAGLDGIEKAVSALENTSATGNGNESGT